MPASGDVSGRPDPRRYLRDLAALSALSGFWTAKDGQGIATDVAEVLVSVLHLDCAHVRLLGPGGAVAAEATSCPEGGSPLSEEEVHRALAQWAAQGAQDGLPDSVGDSHAARAPRTVVTPIGHGAEFGALITVCDRAGYASDEDRLLLGVAANQVALTRQRLQAEEALRTSEQELADLFDRAALGIHWVGPDGTILRVNRAELDLLGYERHEYVGRHVAEFHENVEVIEDILRRLGAGETVRDREARLRCKDGSVKDVVINSNVRWDNGRFVHTRCFTHDVTERKRAERDQALLAAIVKSSDDAIISKTLDGIITSWNAGAARLYGFTAEEAVGQPITIVIPQERWSEEDVILERLRRGEGIDHFETVRKARDGRLIEVSLTTSPIRDRAGRIIGASKVARDITARKRTERRLATQDAVTRALADSAALSEAAPRILGAVCEHLGWEVGGFWSVDSREGVLRCSEVWAAPGQTEFKEECRRRTFGPGMGLPGRVWAGRKAVWIEDVTEDANFCRSAAAERAGLHGALGFPIMLGGEVLGVIEFFSPAIREPDEDLLEMMTGIGSQVGQFIERKHAELENVRLVEALKTADRRKDEFLATLAHELRNPLAPIRNTVDLLRARDSEIPELRRPREILERQVHQLTRLVDDLLDVSRITQGKVELRKERIDLASIVNGALEVSRSLIEQMGHRLTVSLPPEPIVMEADPTRLTQVLANLLNNAAKYTEQGGSLCLSAEVEGAQIVIAVRDTGMGIPAAKLPQVFEMFTQLDPAVDRSQGGLGIGLTLVKNLVEMHGGTVEAHSAGIGKGSEFIVRIPLAPETPPAPQREAPPRRELSPAVTPRRILVVDDNRDAVESLAELLTLFGHEVETAHDGMAAVRAAAAFRPEAVILDIGLPGLDGYEAARRIRDQPEGGGMLLIALTGRGQEEDRRRSKEAGFDYHVTKPLEIETLEQLLRETPRTAAG